MDPFCHPRPKRSGEATGRRSPATVCREMRHEHSSSDPRRFLPRNAWGDGESARRRFVRRHGRSPSPREPKRLTDYLYRIKVDGSLTDPLRQFVTDKEFAKLYIAHTVGPDYLPETYRVLRTADDIEAFVPDRVPCVVKPTHLSGSVLFHTDPDENC